MKRLTLLLLLLLSFSKAQEDSMPIFDVCYEVGMIQMQCDKISKAIANAYTRDIESDAKLYSLCYRICKDPYGYHKARGRIMDRIKKEIK